VKPFTINGLRSAYLEWGDASKPLVVMVHGFPDTPHSWSTIAPTIAAKGYWVVAPFLRGYSPSEAGPRDTSAQDLAEDGAAYAPALGRETCHLVGHDWGTELAWGAVGLKPERFLSVTAIAIPHRARLIPKPHMLWGLRHFVSFNLPGAEARFARDDFAELEMLLKRWSPTWKFSAEELAQMKDCFRQPGTVHAALGYYRSLSPFLPACMKAKVTVPTLCISGGDDPALKPEDYEPTRAHFVNGMELVTVPGGHFCHRESPQLVIDAILKHLKR